MHLYVCQRVWPCVCVGGHLACRLRARLGDPASVSLSLYWFLSLSSELQRCCWPSGVQDASRAHDASPWLPLVHSHPSLRWRDGLVEEEESRWRCWTSSLPPTLSFFFLLILSTEQNGKQRNQDSEITILSQRASWKWSLLIRGSFKSTITCKYKQCTHFSHAYGLVVCSRVVLWGSTEVGGLEGCCVVIWVFQTQ